MKDAGGMLGESLAGLQLPWRWGAAWGKCWEAGDGRHVRGELMEGLNNGDGSWIVGFGFVRHDVVLEFCASTACTRCAAYSTTLMQIMLWYISLLSGCCTL